MAAYRSTQPSPPPRWTPPSSALFSRIDRPARIEARPLPSKAPVLPMWGNYEQVRVRYDRQRKAVWYSLAPKSRPCFNPELLDELRRFQHRIEQVNQATGPGGPDHPVRYTVLASSVPGVFNLGGDLALFSQLIQARDRDGLSRYAKACIDVLYPNAVNFGQDLTTISLVQGDALGGGFEAAISSNVIIAEKRAKFGLPEILFNLIPGMGAYSFLIRRTTPAIAERLITSGEVLSAAEMYELNLIDELVEDGEGEAAVNAYMKRQEKRANAYAALNRVRQCVNPVTYDELIRITQIWVDAALQLTKRDLRLIERLVSAQNRLTEKNLVSEEAMASQA